MCEPTTLFAISIAATAIGTGMSMYGQAQQQSQQQQAIRQQQTYQQRVNENNAKVAEWQAEDALKRGELEATEHAIGVAKLLGRQQAVLGASGTDPSQGGAPTFGQQTAETGRLETKTIRSNAEREAYNHKVQASNFTAAGQLNRHRAATAPGVSALGLAGTLFKGVGSVASQWYGYRGAPAGGGSPTDITPAGSNPSPGLSYVNSYSSGYYGPPIYSPPPLY